MRRRLLVALVTAAALWLAATGVAALLLPRLLLNAHLPTRREGECEALRARLQGSGRWTRHPVPGGQGAPLEVWWLHRPGSRGAAILLHGFGDDGWGPAPLAEALPEWDILLFTFRGRDRHPEIPSTLGGHERWDAVSAVRLAEAGGWPRHRILFVAASQGAGVALLALEDLETEGPPLAGALLESPFRDLQDAARNHVRGTLGSWEPLSRPAVSLALRVAGRRAAFDPGAVSPLRAAAGLRTPVALLAGDADQVTPLAGVRALARTLPDLTLVPGAGHGEVGARVPGGWAAWATQRLTRWGLTGTDARAPRGR